MTRRGGSFEELGLLLTNFSPGSCGTNSSPDPLTFHAMIVLALHCIQRILSYQKT